MNDFEQRLRTVPVKPVPADWRAEILTAAGMYSVPASREPWWARCQAQLNALLWPHPKAWAGLAAMWVFILLLYVSSQDETSGHMAPSAPPSPEMQAEIRQQQQWLMELVGANETQDADRPKTGPGQPRTQVTRILLG